LNVNRAVGTDGAPGSIIKLIFRHRTQVMLDIFSSIYNIGRLPARWKITRLILLNKPGKDPRLASAYRPISILPAISKIWENTFKTVTENELGLDPFHRN
jgi:hypothetical protein